jgi:hypothetical protein
MGPRTLRLSDSLKSKTFWGVVAWVAAGTLLAFFNRQLWDAIWVLTLGLWAVYAVAGLLLSGVMFWLGWRRARLIGIAVYITAFIVVILALALALPHVAVTGDEFQFSRRFVRLKPQYEAIVAQLLAAGKGKDGEANGVRYTVDAGPPLRIAFPQPGGLLDNWEGVVWDPTGIVRSATGWRNGIGGDYTASTEAKALFGGDLVACRHVAGYFYRCWFT